MIERYPHRPDWFVIAPAQAQSIGEAPGVQMDERRGLWICHRTHLPLIGADLVPQVQPSGTGLFGDGQTELRSHQKTGVDYIKARYGTLLADAMRTGKTGTIVASHDPDSGPLVVVGPMATRSVWCSWFKRRWPNVEPICLEGQTYDPDQFGDDPKCIFVHYDILKHWVSVGFRYRIGTAVFDEGHVLAKGKSQMSQNALEVAGGAERVILSTGTPLYNKPDSIYNLLTICNPAGWGSYWDFIKRYCSAVPGSHGWQIGDPSNVDEFRARLAEVMLRRRWGHGELKDQMPETKRVIERAPVTPEQNDQLDRIAAALTSETDKPTVIGQMARYRKLVGTAKIEPTAALARQKAKLGPVVVWVWHKQVARELVDQLHGELVYTITSDVADKHRDPILDKWRATTDGILIMSMGVGQAGINLAHAKEAIFAELDWTPATIGQAEMRTFDPSRPDTITYVVAEHEIDEKLVRVLAEKCERALIMGTPAADTAIDVLGQILSGSVESVDLDSLAARVKTKVRDEGTTFA